MFCPITLSSKWFLFALAFCLPAWASAQASLRLDTVKQRKDYPTIEFTLVPQVRDKLLALRGAKVELHDVPVRLDGARRVAKELRLRGRSSLDYRRKSYTVELDEPLPISFDSGTVSLKKFYLVSMNMDRHYFHNKLAYACLSQLGLFNLKNRFLELRINRQTEGIYLLLQRPEDYVFDDLGGIYYLRRGYHNEIEEDEFEEDPPEAFREARREQFHQVFEAVDSLRGMELAHYLQARLNLRDYMRWMAFNYWIRNGDYSDEVFFYLTRRAPDAKFQVLAWDFDDIFAEHPHEGPGARSQWLGDQMIFSAECTLDRIIGRDEVLYAMYLDELRYVLTVLSPERTAAICAGIYAELAPLFRKRSLVRMAQFDRGGGTDPTSMRQALERAYQEVLVARRAEILDRLGR